MDVLTAACALLLGVVLVGSGGWKLTHLQASANAIFMLLPKRVTARRGLARVGAPVLGCGEVALGAVLLGWPRWSVPVATVTLAVFVAFLAVLEVAVRRKVDCGCFPSSGASATRADLVRTTGLAVLAAVLLIGAGTGHAATPWHWPSIALGIAFALIGVGWEVMVRRRRAKVGLPRVRGAERTAVLQDVAEAPSFRALLDWLGPRAREVQLRQAQVNDVTWRETDRTGAPRWFVVKPPPRPDLRLTISVPRDPGVASDVVITARSDGRAALVSCGQVREIAEVTAAR